MFQKLFMIVEERVRLMFLYHKITMYHIYLLISLKFEIAKKNDSI